MSIGRIMGYVIVALVALAALAGIATKYRLIRNQKLAAFISKHHRFFALGALSLALVHAIYNFSLFGVNPTGALTFLVLLAQAVVGNLAQKPGAAKALVIAHGLLPIAFIGAVLLHIFS